MNWVVLVFSAAALFQESLGAYPEYDQRQQVTGFQGSTTGYRGPPVVPVILPGGFIADTEEVAKAKDLHFNAYAQAATAQKNSRYNAADEDQYNQPKYTGVSLVQPAYTAQQDYNAPQYQQNYNVPQRQQDYNVPQRQQDYNVPQQRYTGPAARAYVEPKQEVNYQQQSEYSTKPRYQGPPVIPVVLPNGYIAETADVEAAKEHHFQLVAQAQAAVARAQERANSNKYGYTRSYQEEDDGNQYEEPKQNYNQYQQNVQSAPVYSRPRSQPARQQYQGPNAVPVVLPSGHIADTAEVAAARISHLQQLLDAAQKSLPQQGYHNSR